MLTNIFCFYAGHIALCLATLICPLTLFAQRGTPSHTPPTIQMPAWQPHPTLKGAASMTLAGDRMQPGMFTIRVKYPDGLHIPPHTHPLELHTTILQGMLCVGIGNVWDSSKVQCLASGQFMRFAAGVPHFEYTVGETILQISGLGPMQTQFIDSTQQPFIAPSNTRRTAR